MQKEDKRLSEKRATCKGVEKMIAEAGYPGVEYVHGEGYYYFTGGIADKLCDQSLGCFHIQSYRAVWSDFIWKLNDEGHASKETCGACGVEFDMFNGAEIVGVKTCDRCLKLHLDAQVAPLDRQTRDGNWMVMFDHFDRGWTEEVFSVEAAARAKFKNAKRYSGEIEMTCDGKLVECWERS